MASKTVKGYFMNIGLGIMCPIHLCLNFLCSLFLRVFFAYGYMISSWMGSGLWCINPCGLFYAKSSLYIYTLLSLDLQQKIMYNTGQQFFYFLNVV